MAGKGKTSLTAFPEKEALIRGEISSVDACAFHTKKIGRCSSLDKMECHGLCCSFGVSLLPEEVEFLTRLIKEERDTLRDLGIAVPATLSTVDKDSSISFLAKKRRAPAALGAVAYKFVRNDLRYLVRHPRYASYIIYSTCVFGLPNGYCVLETLSRAKGLHHWYYKPINCWMFPLQIKNGVLTMLEKDAYPFLPCDRIAGGETIAFEALQEELSFLSRIIERDLIAEIAPYNNTRK